MGGVTRMTLALAVIMMEMSNDVRILLPAMVAIMLAKWVADAGCHSLYHGLLEVKCVPFLPKEATTSSSLELLEVRHVMAKPVVTLYERMKLGDIRDVLRSTNHNGFPIVSRFDEFLIGLVAREHLLKLLVEAVRRGTCEHLEVGYSDLDQGLVDPMTSAAEEEQQLAVLEGHMASTQGMSSANFWEEELDLFPYINMSTYRVSESFSVEKAYLLFTTMGLRHLVVVDEANHVRGIITRKNLLGYRIDEAIESARRSGLNINSQY